MENFQYDEHKLELWLHLKDYTTKKGSELKHDDDDGTWGDKKGEKAYNESQTTAVDALVAEITSKVISRLNK